MMIFCGHFILFAYLYLASVLANEDSSQSVSWRKKPAVNEETCTKDSCRKSTRYFLYDVNPGEGFNLRRDVYIRAAVFVKFLNELDPQSRWTLVLPPWGPLYHWKTSGIRQEGLDWKLFFDLEKLRDYVPVCEFDDYLSERKEPVVDKIFYLLSFDYTKVNLQSEWLLEEVECSQLAGFPYPVDHEKNVKGWFWGFDGIYAKSVQCFQALGSTHLIVPKLLARISLQDRAVMFERFETLLHDHFGGAEYWKARSSMQFAAPLLRLASEFLGDNGLISANETKGGPFVCAHLRRQDYLHARPDACPSMREAALQLRKILIKEGVSAVFIATDGTTEEINQLQNNLQSFSVLTFVPSGQLVKEIKDGGVAIIEQAICSRAQFFIGSYESTFSFRIQEEREIIGFHPDTTFNRFCKTADVPCEQPTRWRINT